MGHHNTRSREINGPVPGRRMDARTGTDNDHPY